MTGVREELAETMTSAQRNEEHRKGGKELGEYLGEEHSKSKVTGVGTPGDTGRQCRPEGQRGSVRWWKLQE